MKKKLPALSRSAASFQVLFMGVAAALSAGCTVVHRIYQTPEPQPLPPIMVEQVIPQLPPEAVVRRDTTGMKRITMSANNADVRTLILGIADQVGLNVVVSPAVRGRVSVNFHDVPAIDALKSIMEEAHLSFATAPWSAPWGPVVYYKSKVQIDSLTALQLQRQFGVTPELAAFIVEDRVRVTPP